MLWSSQGVSIENGAVSLRTLIPAGRELLGAEAAFAHRRDIPVRCGVFRKSIAIGAGGAPSD